MGIICPRSAPAALGRWPFSPRSSLVSPWLNNILIIAFAIIVIVTIIPAAGIDLLGVNNKSLKEGVNLFKANNKDVRATSLASFKYLYC